MGECELSLAAQNAAAYCVREIPTIVSGKHLQSSVIYQIELQWIDSMAVPFNLDVMIYVLLAAGQQCGLDKRRADLKLGLGEAASTSCLARVWIRDRTASLAPNDTIWLDGIVSGGA
jgi:hypothetical protein